MQKKVLKNGLTVIYDERDTDSVAVEVLVKVGSNNENDKIRGISHFLEHMLFEGTKTRTNRQIAQQIESVGGEMNAATTNERTIFYIHILGRYIDKCLEILADIIKNSIFSEKEFEKERKVILEEISMIQDDPKLFQFDYFMSKLFKKHPSKYSVIGTKESISKMKRGDLVSYFKKYYVPNNMVLAISGNVKNILDKIERYFGDIEPGKEITFEFIKEVKDKKPEGYKLRKNIDHSYLILGYKTVPRTNKDSYALDVIQSLLSRGFSSRLLDEIRNKRGLAYNVGAIHESMSTIGYFLSFLSTDKKNLDEARKILLEQFNLPGLNEKELKEAKDYIEGNMKIKQEDNKERSDFIGFWELVEDCKRAENYFNEIRKVTVNDVKRVVRKYFDGNYTEILLEQKD
ncbi:insulinase family protein [Candidatus Woesearchaeota archaeon]|nr:insulinase family protein [Candidatus Woesearchaeota archaeon]